MATRYSSRSKELQFLRRPCALLPPAGGAFLVSFPTWQLEVDDDEEEPAEASRRPRGEEAEQLGALEHLLGPAGGVHGIVGGEDVPDVSRLVAPPRGPGVGVPHAGAPEHGAWSKRKQRRAEQSVYLGGRGRPMGWRRGPPLVDRFNDMVAAYGTHLELFEGTSLISDYEEVNCYRRNSSWD